MVGREKLPDLSMSNIFSVLSIVFIYMTSFWPEVQSCYNNAKGQSLKLKASVLYETFPILKQAGIVIHFLNLKIVTE